MPDLCRPDVAQRAMATLLCRFWRMIRSDRAHP
jgi:hypothetical protein